MKKYFILLIIALIFSTLSIVSCANDRAEGKSTSKKQALSIDPSGAVTMTVDESKDFTVTVTNAELTDVSCDVSGDATVIEYSSLSNGKFTVTAKKVGVVELIVSLASKPDIKQTVTITVNEKPIPTPTLTIEPNGAVTMTVDETMDFTVTVTNAELTDLKLDVSGDTTAIEYSSLSNGKFTVTAKSVGIVELIVSLASKPDIKKTVTITVKEKPNDPDNPTLSIAPSTAATMTVDETKDFTVTVTNAELTDVSCDVSGDATVIEYSSLSDGKFTVTAKKAGTVELIVSLASKPTIKQTVTITVNEKPIPTPTLSIAPSTAVTMTVDQTMDFTVTVTNAELSDVGCSLSGDATVIEHSSLSNGKFTVTAKNAGTVELIVSLASNATIKQTVTITVKDKPSGISISLAKRLYKSGTVWVNSDGESLNQGKDNWYVASGLDANKTYTLSYSSETVAATAAVQSVTVYKDGIDTVIDSTKSDGSITFTAGSDTKTDTKFYINFDAKTAVSDIRIELK